MNYETLRHFADSWALVAMGALFTLFTGWTFRRGAKAHHHDAAAMIFRDDHDG